MGRKFQTLSHKQQLENGVGAWKRVGIAARLYYNGTVKME